MPILRICFALLLGILCQSQALAEADSLEKKIDQRKVLREQIDTLEKDQQSKRQSAEKLRTELLQRERQLVDAQTSLSSLQRQIKDKEEHLQKLKHRTRLQSEQLAEQKGWLQQQVRAAYIQGRQDYMKLLLNQEDPALLSRNLIYHDYFNRARARNIQRVTEHLQELTSLEEAIKLETSKLRQLKQGQLSQVNAISEGRSERQQLISKLEKEIKRQGNQLQSMQKDLSQLEQLISELQQQPKQTETNPLPFASLKGKLPWPTKGRLTSRFGSSRNKGSLRWQGVVLEAEAGTQVQAVSHGRVVFADWFRNLGLLIIIDHGDGYMTLYGHNESLYKRAGDMVEAGELIGTVGNTGGNLKTSLYFEIRDQGSPSDPARWCRKRKRS